MAKKRSIAKAFVGLTATAVAAKVVYDKYKILKDKFEKEENESITDEVKKYNVVATSRTVEVEDEEFEGCEIKAVASKLVLDLSLAVFEKDEYINFESNTSSVKIILPEGVNVTCDIENVASGIKNLVDNTEEEDIPTLFIIGKSTLSQIEVIPAGFYVDDDDFEDDFDDDFVDETNEGTAKETANETEADTDETETKKEKKEQEESEYSTDASTEHVEDDSKETQKDEDDGIQILDITEE